MGFKEENIKSMWDGSTIGVKFIEEGFFDTEAGEFNFDSAILKIIGGSNNNLIRYVKSRGYSYNKIESL
ncbi:hypothetical protein [Leuconostoc citreum]|uniref:hypothetical protein n=1 Tax=Leuconostoc citreum TaxID=33964 RepID=UPI000C28E8A9|nr:hypothetical protein [Leuconostoc citreum]